MAFAFVGDRGATNQKSSGTTLSMSPNANMPVGALHVVWFTTDSVHNPGSPEADFNRRMRAYDSAGNTYITLGAQTDGGTNIYCMAALFVSRLRYGLTTAQTVTVEFDTNGGTQANAMMTAEFSMTVDPLMTWAVSSRGPVNSNSRAVDPPAVTISSLASGFQYLLLHLLAGEGPDTDAYTWDADYTQVSGSGTTGGADDTNQHIRGGWRIATLTTDTVDVTSTTADRDYTQIYTALCEVAMDGAFPNWPVLDDFNRADENPLDNGTWNTTDSATDGQRGQLISNQAAAGTTVGGSFWNTTLSGADGEAYMTIATIGTSPTATALHFHTAGQANTANMDGWAIEYTTGATNSVGPHINVGSSANGASAAQVDNLAMRIWSTLTNGSKIGIQRRAPITHVWVDYAGGGGWEWVAAVHESVTINAGRPAFSLRASTTRIDDFGAGVEPGWAPQIYRRPFG